jgi:hypothetical protein
MGLFTVRPFIVAGTPNIGSAAWIEKAGRDARPFRLRGLEPDFLNPLFQQHNEMARTVALSYGPCFMFKQGVANIDRRASGPEPVRRAVPQAVHDLAGSGDAAVRAFELVDRKIAMSWMLLDNSEPYWFAAPRAGIFHKKVERHGSAPHAARWADLSAGRFVFHAIAKRHESDEPPRRG